MFLARLRLFNLSLKNNKMAAKVFLSCIVTAGVNNVLAYDWRDTAKKMLQKGED